nr:hypothetical protein [uncultured Dethiosulfovibrio sp.]
MSTEKLHPADLLSKVLPDRARDIEPGKLKSSTERLSDPAEAIGLFNSFGGEGWICTASTSDIIRFSPSAPLMVSGGWPICGEAVKGKESLHLNRCDSGWELVTVSREDSNDDHDTILSSSFTAKGGGRLRYETYWGLADVAGQVELRPVGFRFVGFEPKKEG